MADSGDRPEPPPGTPEDVTHALLASAVDEWAAAIVANDAERIAAFMADEWVIVSESGITDRETFLAFVASGDLTHSAMQAITPPRIRVHGGTAVVTVRITNTAHYGGDRFDADEWTTDVFVRRDGHWRCVLSHITPAAAPPSDS
ncbi:nuclear transport factor 2 family protein [Streptomyces sp. NPDC006261]|uniref:nuclear transport factor 2 family protein n=1 Tax=Streptomyces sp. NPDC006261 TaxID=3156739 RepID=UPI0033B57A46